MALCNLSFKLMYFLIEYILSSFTDVLPASDFRLLSSVFRLPAFSSYVLCFFFLAAGKSTLFKIRRYPGELGYKFRSVAGSPTKCW